MRRPGLALSSSSRPISPVVSAVFGRWMVRKSDSATTCSSDISSTPPSRARSGRHVGVEGDEAHAEAARPVGDELADPSEADDAERLVGELDALPLAALPATVDEGGVGLRDVARLGEQQRHRVLGRRDDVRLRGVDDHHAAGRRSVEVDVVESDSCPADDHQPVGRGEQLAVDRRRRADDQRLGAGDGVEQLGCATARVAHRRCDRRPRRRCGPLSEISSVTRTRAMQTACLPRRYAHVRHELRSPASRTQRRGPATRASRSGSSLAACPTSSSAGLRPGTSGAGRSRCSSSPTCCSGSTPSTSPTGRGCATSSPRCSCSPCSWLTWIGANLLRGRQPLERPATIGPVELALLVDRPGDSRRAARPMGRRRPDGRRRDHRAVRRVGADELRRGAVAGLGGTEHVVAAAGVHQPHRSGPCRCCCCS